MGCGGGQQRGGEEDAQTRCTSCFPSVADGRSTRGSEVLYPLTLLRGEPVKGIPVNASLCSRGLKELKYRRGILSSNEFELDSNCKYSHVLSIESRAALSQAPMYTGIGCSSVIWTKVCLEI